MPQPNPQNTAVVPHRSVASRIVRSALWLLFANPYPVVVAIVLGYILIHAVAGLYAHVDQTGWHLRNLGNCMLCVGVLGILILIAVGHVLVTLSSGWREKQ